MTKRQVKRYWNIRESLRSHGMNQDEIHALLRASKVLSTWGENECNGYIERDEETGKTYRCNGDGKRLYKTADRKTGALNRAKRITESHGCQVYHQGDPRGCALYLIRSGDVRPEESVDSVYTRGIALCID